MTPISKGTSCSSPTIARMSAVEPSREVPIACSSYPTRSCAARRRWISAMYSDAEVPGRPRAMTVRSAVAMGSAGRGRREPVGLGQLGVLRREQLGQVDHYAALLPGRVVLHLAVDH